LPNHFSSTDPRTVILAKYLCELVTEAIKVYEGRSDRLPAEVASPSDELCRKVLGSIHVCKNSGHFPIAHAVAEAAPKDRVSADSSPPACGPSADLDEDDDSDLEPIDSVDVACKSKIVYIRDFLEGLPELKTYDEVAAAFSALPAVTRNQESILRISVSAETFSDKFYSEKFKENI
jgi:hypothetical protein